MVALPLLFTFLYRTSKWPLTRVIKFGGKNPADLHIFLTEITTQTVNCRLKDLGLHIFVRDFRKAYTWRGL